jgi:ParB/RepB/Spo0J family partition protein
MSKESDILDTPAAGTEAPAQLAILSRDLLVRSRSNPRTHFDPAYIEQLADSIRQHGILQPILVRPVPAARLQETFEDRAPGAPLPTHEIICGECRWRATAVAKVYTIPVLVRHLDDLQVLQVQLVENLRRKDLHPLEEAEGFDRLMHDHHLAVADIAARIDKSESYIYKSLKLLELTAECRAQMYEGKLTQSTALLVARAPAHLQLQIAKDIMRPQGVDNEPMSFRQAARHIQQHYMLQLAHAVFDIKDASLVPRAGACSDCARNTGSSTDLFADVAGGDTCTDPKCFDGKKVAHFAQVARTAEANGQKVIQGKEAKALYAYEGATPTGYKLLDEKDYIDGRMTSVRAAIGKGNLPTPVIIIDPHTKAAVEALPVDVASKLLAKASAAKSTEKKNAGPGERDLQEKFEEAWQEQAITQIHAAIMAGRTSGITVALARHIALYYSQSLYGESAARFTRLFNVGAAKVATRDGISDFLKTCPDEQVGPALLMLMAEDGLDTNYGDIKEHHIVELLAADSGVDLKAIQDQVKADMKAAAAERKDEADAKAGKAKPAAKGKAKKTTAAEAKAGISAALTGTIPAPKNAQAFELDETPAWPLPKAEKATAKSSGKGKAQPTARAQPASNAAWPFPTTPAA